MQRINATRRSANQPVFAASIVCAALVALTTGQAFAACPFNVSDTASAARTTSDALLLARAARGANNTLLTANTATNRSGESILTDVDNKALRLDVNGSGVFDETDAAIIARYTAGFRGDALIPSGAGEFASRTTGAAIQSFIENGCVVRKRLIELGWDSPSPSFMKANIATMTQRPFSGTAVRLSVGQEIFRKTAYPESAFTQDRSDLSTTAFGTLTDNFVSVWSASENGWSWFSDSDWLAAQTNAVNFAKTAKAGNFKGFFFDPEPYGNNAWQYTTARYPTQSFAAVQAKVRQRGAAFMSAVQTEMPNIKIMLLFGTSIVKLQTEAYSAGILQNAEWALWASFIDGMLDVIGPHVQLIDGDELSYYYTTAQKFSDYRADKRDSGRYVSPENRAKYDKHLRVAHAIFADGTLNLWNSSRFIGKYFSTDAERKQWIEFTTYHGARASDEYLWVYNENMDWWGSRGAGVQLPAGLENSLSTTLQKINNNQPLGFALTPAMESAAFVYEDKRFLGGAIKDVNGNPVAGVSLESSGIVGSGEPSGLGDPFCSRVNSDGSFACFFPRNASYTITPKKAGVTFTPASRTYSPTTNPSSQFGNVNQDFVANP